MSQPQVRGGGVGARNGGGNKRQQPSQDQKTNNNGGRSLSNFSFASLGESEEGGGDKRVGDESASRRTSAVTNTTQRHQSGSTSGAAISTTQQQQEISGGEKSKTAVATSNSHRLSSIDILNENKQRQLQLKQQESFKLHLEQRQKFIQQQQQQEGAGLRQAGPGGQGGANQDDDDDETSSLGVTYQVNTSAPDYMASAVAKSSSGAKQAEPRRATSGGSVGGGWIAVNPFDDESSAARAGGSKVDALPKRPSSAAGGRFEDGRQHPATAAIQSPTSEKSATVSGFLSSLSDANDGPSQHVVDETGDELIHNSKRLLAEARRQQQQESGVDGQTASTAAATLATRYTKVVEEGMSSYNYDDDPGKKPFYQKDFATLLQDCRGSRKLVIMIVAIALLLDNMLLTSVVPIIPAYLYKLRIERQHRELLENGPSPTSNMNKSQTAGKSWRPGQQQASQDDGGTAAVDEDELARRINQSLSAAKDRYSGSVFHPRVRTSTMRTTLAAADGDDDNDGDIDDQDDDAGQRSKSSQRNRASGSGKRVRPKQGGRKQTASKQRDGVGDSDDEDDGDDDDGDANDDDAGASKQSGRGRDKNPSSTRRVDQKNRKDQNDDSDVDDDDDNSDEAVRKGSRKSSRGRNQDDDDDDGDDDDNGRQSTRISFRKRPPPDANFALSRSMIRDKTDSKARNNDDDDDEDRDNSAKWSKLRDSLVAMARKGSNDTEQLGGMCLTMVLNPDSLNGRNDNDAADDGESTSSNGNSKAEVEATSGKKQRNPRAQEMDDEDDGDDDGRLTANGKQRSRNKGPVRRVIKPKARPTTPSPSQNDQKKAGSGDDDDDELVISHQDIVDESFEVGVMFASKPIVQAFANPFIGTLTNRVGFTIPMFTGFVIMFLSTLVFAFGSTYSTLFIARAIQGVGSACTSVAGMSMLADRFPDDAERGNAMAIALGGLALGVVIGPPFGGFMYEFVGKASPFIVLSILALLDGLLQLMVLQPRVSKNQEEGASLLTLIKDPYILVAAGAITFANTGIAILEPALPLWMMDTMQAKNWEQGVAFLPAALSYMFGTNLSGNLGLKIGRWRATMIGLVIIGCSLLLIPFATRVEHLIVPNGAIGFAMGMVDSSMMPMLGYLVDIRHTSVYGSVYAIGDVAFCASFAFGPALSGTLVELIGFEGLIITTAIICFAFAPLLLLLRNPPARQVNEAQLQEQSMRYVNYSHLDSPDEEAQLTGDYKSTAKSYVR